MLVLTRKEGEKLQIGDNITVVVSRVAGNRVTLGIEAPSDVRIVRGELKDKPPKIIFEIEVEIKDETLSVPIEQMVEYRREHRRRPKRSRR